MRVPESTASEPFFVARRLRRISDSGVMRTDKLALAYIGQAADMISEQAKKIAALSLKVANYERERVIGLPRTAPHGRILRGKTPEFIAQKIVDAVESKCDLWRARCGGYRLVRAGAFVAGEFIAAIDENSTFHDVYTAITGAPKSAKAPKPPRARKEKPKNSVTLKSSPGYTVKAGKDQAEKVAELIEGTVDLYRLRAGAVRVVKADEPANGGEFLGRFNEGATWQDIQEALG
jgi:hypothetical protein